MPPTPDAYLKIASVSRIFFGASSGQDYEALRDVSLSIDKGEFISIIGHSGCGKSTLLNIVAGLDQPTSGHVSVDGKLVREPGPERGIVFQNHSLLPWLSVLQNVELAIQIVWPDLARPDVTSRAQKHLEQVGLHGHWHKRPSEISGGMKQRVGIARAFAIQPKVLLLDEPFGALDALTRARMQDDLLAIWESERKTVLMITHDVDEAIFLSDRIVLMTNGPAAHIGEIATVTIPRPRSRERMIDLSEYDAIRKHLLHYLASRDYRAAATPEPVAAC